jgi:multiple sugar transport system substrate-binding protein
MPTVRRKLAIALAVLAVLAAGCSSGGDGGGGGDDGGGGGGGGPIQFWTGFIEPERIEIQNQIITAFTEASGIEVELVPVAEDELASLIVNNAASGDLPEVVYHPVDFAIGWAEQGLLDTEAAAAVIESLGQDTFNERAIALASNDEGPVTVPADAWGQLLLYRTDLFEEAGLDPPESYEAILAAAEALNDPDGQVYGITASTDPADVFTQQTFEQVALANGCQLIEGEEIALESEACVEALSFYQDLINNYSPGSVQDVDTTRATYFAGQSAMLIWSPFILDELAGLREDALPTCEECSADPRFLAENTGFVPAFSGGDADPAQYGQVAYFGIGAGSDTEEAQQFVEFLLSEGYGDWLSIAPEGQFPMRTGNADDPEAYVTEWQGLDIGVDQRAPMSEIYGQEVIDTLIEGTDQFRRWGFEEGRGALVSSVYESLIVPQTLAEVLGGGLTPEDAAAQLQTEAQEQLESLPE